MQAHLGSDALKALGQEVRRAHPGLQGTEGVFDSPPSDTHAIGRLIQPRRNRPSNPVPRLRRGTGLLGRLHTKRSSEKRFQKFEQDWNDTLQVMRSIASRVSAPGAKPGWIDASVAPGVQADQFLHAYYYKQVKDGNRHPYEEFFARNSKNPELALRDALEWWHDADFDHSFEERTIYEWSPRLRELLARDRILKLTEQEFVDAVSRVHAIRDHAIKQENEHLGLPDRPQAGDDKFEKFGEWLWRQRSREGRTMLELLNYAVWGNGSVSARLWNAIRSDDWAIPHIGLSSLGEIVGWARPDEFPPRNMRTSKGLRALGYNVRIGV